MFYGIWVGVRWDCFSRYLCSFPIKSIHFMQPTRTNFLIFHRTTTSCKEFAVRELHISRCGLPSLISNIPLLSGVSRNAFSTRSAFRSRCPENSNQTLNCEHKIPLSYSCSTILLPYLSPTHLLVYGLQFT